MRDEYEVTITYEHGGKTRCGFNTLHEANEFRAACHRWKYLLKIKEVGEVVELHPANRYYSPYIVKQVETYLAALKTN